MKTTIKEAYAKVFCTNCGNELSDDSIDCSVCGAPPRVPVNSSADNEKTAEGQAADLPEEEHSSYVMSNSNINDKPLSTVDFFFMQILFMIPFLNLFLILLWSFKKNTNINRRAYACSMLIWSIIATGIAIFVILTLAFLQYPISIGSCVRILRAYLNKFPNL